MSVPSPNDLLDLLLAGGDLNEGQLVAFVRKYHEEGQYHDYKSGRLVSAGKAKQAARTIREYVGGFANSDGGVLIVGVGEGVGGNRPIEPCGNIGSEPLDKWAEAVLRDMLPYCSPPPRLHVVDHNQGKVLLIAVARAPVLVPCIESGRPKYFLRFNQSTYSTPDWLLSDLVLGRRQHPVVEVQVNVEQPPTTLVGTRSKLNFRPIVENTGLVSAEQPQLGIISWAAGTGAEVPVSGLLRTYLNVEEPGRVEGVDWVLRHSPIRLQQPPTSRRLAG